MTETSTGRSSETRSGTSLLTRLPRLIWRERELAVARLASTLTHTLGTPLQVIAGRAALARKSGDPDDIARHLEIIQRKCSEITGLLWRVLDSLRVEQPAVGAPLDVSAFVGTVVDDLRAVSSARDVRWTLSLCGEPDQLGSPNLCADDLRHALLSAALSVLAETPDGSQLGLSVERLEQEGKGLTPVHDSVLVFIFSRSARAAASSAEQTGPLQHIAQPWLHSDGRRVDGGALGWAAVYELARGNEGRIEVSPKAVTLSWPVVA